MKLLLPNFGALIPGQGGRFAAIVRAPLVDGKEQPPIALLVTDIDFASPWGEYGKSIPGTESRTDGKANTNAMIAAGCQAALELAKHECEGHADIFIPALAQLNAAACNVPELFGSEVYWTSTQASRGCAFVQDFALGGSYWDGKGNEWRVRPFRQIPLEFLTA